MLELQIMMLQFIVTLMLKQFYVIQLWFVSSILRLIFLFNIKIYYFMMLKYSEYSLHNYFKKIKSWAIFIKKYKDSSFSHFILTNFFFG